MKRWYVLVLTGLFFSFGGLALTHGAPNGLSVGMGLDFPHYEGVYVEPTFGFHAPIAEGVDFDLGGAFGIRMVGSTPWFLIPVRGGVSFWFSNGQGIFPYIGVGLAPLVGWHDSVVTFHMGPYFKAGVRFQIHPLMSVYGQAEQSLLIGAPQWLSTGTRIEAGIDFKLSAE